jgi:hypothetical protein
MPPVNELPDLVGEFIDMSRQYLREQTLEPARALGRLAGFSAVASVLFVLSAGLLGVAGTRWLLRVMPDGQVWSGFGYMLGAVGLLIVTGLVMWRATR